MHMWVLHAASGLHLPSSRSAAAERSSSTSPCAQIPTLVTDDTRSRQHPPPTLTQEVGGGQQQEGALKGPVTLLQLLGQQVNGARGGALCVGLLWMFFF